MHTRRVSGFEQVMNSDNIILVGMMGAGKSTIGKALAEHLDFQFIDLDKEIERSAGTSIPDIFDQEGEDYFRNLETQIIRQLAGISKTVVATGGGAPVRDENRELLRGLGKIVWLDISPAAAAQRIQDSDRPLLADGDVKDKLDGLLVQRRFAYEDCDLRVDGDQAVGKVVAKIAAG